MVARCDRERGCRSRNLVVRRLEHAEVGNEPPVDRSAMTSTVTTSMRDGGTLVHAALLYRRTEQLRLALQEFVGDAAVAGEGCLVALPADHVEQFGDMLQETGATVRLENMAEFG